MLTVKQEWEEAADDESILAWARKWGSLLVEDWNNPIWTSGYTQGQKEFLDKMRGLREGNPVPDNLPPEMVQYANAVEILEKNLRFITYNMIAEPAMAAKITEKELLDIAAKQIAPVITNFIEVDTEELENGNINFIFNLVIVQ